jgi:outer membrane immunogenic protein
MGAVMKKLLLAGVSVAALMIGAESGYAADMARPVYKAPPPPAPIFSWTGCYAGGQVGWGWARNRIDQNTVSSGTVGGTIIVFANTSSSGHVDSSGAVFGGQIGCDYQFVGSSVVVGVQAMGLGTDIVGLGQDPHNGLAGLGAFPSRG